jgi:predicted RNA methylase
MSRFVHQQPQYPDLHGQFRKSYHMEMVADCARTDAIFAALQQVLTPETVFCELGCGSGVFSVHAAARCRKVYAVELDEKTAQIAQENFQRSTQRDRIQFILGDAMEVNLPEPVDVVLAEMMSIWTIEEPQVSVANRAIRELLRPGGRMLPSRIVNLIELGHYPFRLHEIEMRGVTPLFTGIAAPVLLTERRVFKVLDFTSPVDLDLGGQLGLVALNSGKINCAVLSSYVQMGPRSAFSSSDTLMPRTVVPLQEPIDVEAGQVVQVRVAARARSDMGESVFVVESS